MKNLCSTLFFMVILLVGCNSNKQPTGGISLIALEDGFKNIPDSQKLATYWYWVSDNISQEGVVKDLHAMKKAGINRAFIGNIGIGNVPSGKVKFMSDEWWNVLHKALKTATELGIEIGIFNGPGWSQSGGPWVKPEQSMKYLASETLKVSGNGSLQSLKLPEVEDGTMIKVIAYPDIKEDSFSDEINKKSNQPAELVINWRKDYDYPRTLIIKAISEIKTKAVLYVYEGGEYKELKSFDVDRSRKAINVGFDPFAPIVVSLPQSKSEKYKLQFLRPGQGNLKVTMTSKAYVERYPEKTLAKMFQSAQPKWNSYMWNVQTETTANVVVPEQIIDLTDNVNDDGLLNWNVPEGDWTVVNFSMKTTGQHNAPATKEARGLEVDKMNKAYLKEHYDAFIGEILRRIPAEDRKTFRTVVMDSYETGGLNWTDDMETVFEKTYGYSPVPYLPAMRGEVIGSVEMSNRFLWDLRRLIADRVSYDYVGGLRELSHKDGLITWLENYGHWGFPGEFLQYGGQSDEVAGEFWSEGNLGNIENKAASSCAHIYGKRKVWAESFTASRKPFSRYPKLMKQRGDRFFTEGINSTLFHLYIQQPDDRKPGINAWFGNEFNRNNTWFSHLDLFVSYLKRCNFMLQQGTYIADVAYFIGEDVPMMTGVCTPELPKGYSFDYINAEVLMKYADVEDGCLTLSSGMKYRVLVLPQLETMRPELLQKLSTLVKKGLLVLGPSPLRSPSLQNYPECDAKVKTLSAEMWKENRVNKYGSGMVYPANYTLEKLFEDINLFPDMKTDDTSPLLFIHRSMSEGEIYYVSNQSEEKLKTSPVFRVKGLKPELWNPLTSEIRTLPEYSETDCGISVPLAFEPLESFFIIFRKETKEALSNENFPSHNEIANIRGPWKISFESGRGAPEVPIVMDSLVDLSVYPDKRVNYFSGISTYSTSFEFDSDVNKKPLYLDLGKVMVMAKVKINGKYVGGVWTDPYVLPVSDYIVKGKNDLEIEVVNTWMNRLIGDLSLPEEKRIGWTVMMTWSKDTPLQSSGLLGPVRVFSY